MSIKHYVIHHPDTIVASRAKTATHMTTCKANCNAFERWNSDGWTPVDERRGQPRHEPAGCGHARIPSLRTQATHSDDILNLAFKSTGQLLPVTSSIDRKLHLWSGWITTIVSLQRDERSLAAVGIMMWENRTVTERCQG